MIQNNLSFDYLPSGNQKVTKEQKIELVTQLSVSALGGGLPGSKVRSHMKTWFCLFVFLCGAGDRTQGLTNVKASNLLNYTPRPDVFHSECTMLEH